MTYFTNVHSLEELRKEYKRLVKANHPDNGGSVEVIKLINVEYDHIFLTLKEADQQPPNKDKYNTDIDRAMREVINNIINLNVTIEIIGSWVWISGNTYTVKDELKVNGFHWASKKRMWMWHAKEDSVKSNGKKSIDEIRNKYGSQILKSVADSIYISA